MDSALFPKVLWNLIKEYMPYCHQCYININNIRERFLRDKEIVFKGYYDAIDYFTPPDMYEFHQITCISTNMIKWQQLYFPWIGDTQTYYLSVDEFAIYLAHNCNIGKINIKYNHTQSTSLFGYAQQVKTGYKYYNRTHDRVQSIKNAILCVISRKSW